MKALVFVFTLKDIIALAFIGFLLLLEAYYLILGLIDNIQDKLKEKKTLNNNENENNYD